MWLRVISNGNNKHKENPNYFSTINVHNGFGFAYFELHSILSYADVLLESKGCTGFRKIYFPCEKYQVQTRNSDSVPAKHLNGAVTLTDQCYFPLLKRVSIEMIFFMSLYPLLRKEMQILCDIENMEISISIVHPIEFNVFRLKCSFIRIDQAYSMNLKSNGK